jgi:hypothetical protein
VIYVAIDRQGAIKKNNMLNAEGFDSLNLIPEAGWYDPVDIPEARDSYHLYSVVLKYKLKLH